MATGIPPHEIERWPAGDLQDFMEYDELQPFGVERDNWHAAIIAQLIAAVHTPKRRQPPTVADFMFRDRETRREDDEKHLLNWLRSMKHGKPS